MAQKNKTVFVCSVCGAESIKWLGQCPDCGAWNTMEEQLAVTQSVSSKSVAGVKQLNVSTLYNIPLDDEHRFITNISELDRVLGGGIVKGSVVLLSGDPGIGKSTILLQICNALRNLKILYVSGEESAMQIKLRAERLGVKNENLSIMTETDTELICEYINSSKPDIVMIDSIQTVSISELSSSSGSIVQVRESAKLLLNTGKALGIPVFIVGHVNKGGDIAGPKVLEHIVDTVLYFEGEKNQSYRILRAIKNRYGSTNEIGVFEMSDNGLNEIENPSAMLLSGRINNVSGAAITCIIEGTRPILAEVQALVTATGFGNPRRMSDGFDYTLEFARSDCYMLSEKVGFAVGFVNFDDGDTVIAIDRDSIADRVAPDSGISERRAAEVAVEQGIAHRNFEEMEMASFAVGVFGIVSDSLFLFDSGSGDDCVDAPDVSGRKFIERNDCCNGVTFCGTGDFGNRL